MHLPDDRAPLDTADDPAVPATRITPQRLAALLEAQAVTLLDVRDREEFAGGHLPGARNVPLSSLPGALSSLPQLPVVTVCIAGGRSGRAARWLAAAGVPAAVLDGGLNAWLGADLPFVKP